MRVNQIVYKAGTFEILPPSTGSRRDGKTETFLEVGVRMCLCVCHRKPRYTIPLREKRKTRERATTDVLPKRHNHVHGTREGFDELFLVTSVFEGSRDNNAVSFAL